MNTNTTTAQNTLVEKPVDERLAIYNFLTRACTHLYSKGKFQEQKFAELIESFVSLAKEDPIFMAHLTAWAAKRDSKDLKVLTVFFNSLNLADGSPFFPGSTLLKPNYRNVSAALLQEMPPNLAIRVLELTRYKFAFNDKLSFGAHYSSTLKTAFKKYIMYREANPDMIRGIRKNGMKNIYNQMYRLMRMAPTLETASILGWNQRGRDIVKEKIDFSGLTQNEMAKYIVDHKLSPIIAMSLLPEGKMNVNIARALLTVSTGNQAIILQNMFRTKGFLDVPDVKALFDERITTATTAIDRIDTLAKNLTSEEKKSLSTVRANARKQQMGDIGKIFLHIDKSVSMQNAIEYAKDKASIIAECVNNPEVNFGWALFGTRTERLVLPGEFTRENFHALLFGKRAADGGTDCLGAYSLSRKFRSDVDVFITDQGHNARPLDDQLRDYGDNKPKAVVIVNFGPQNGMLKRAFEKINVPVTELTPNALSESALVAQAVKTAIQGQTAIIDEILDTQLPELPKWYFDKSIQEDYLRRLKG